jgi:hypothetical protein
MTGFRVENFVNSSLLASIFALKLVISPHRNSDLDLIREAP